MAGGKRAYVPKIRGCYECSQRRINCDKRQPTCIKCTKKGIVCSGFGIRYRFSHDVVSKDKNYGNRGHWMPLRTASSTKTGSLGSHTLSSTQALNLNHNQDSSGDVIDFADWPNSANSKDDEVDFNDSNGEQTCPKEGLPAESLSILRQAIQQAANSFTSSPSSLQGWQQYLLAYFSQKIAPELVVIDDQRNGWRYLILPSAHLDDLVKDAVLSASAYHFAVNFKENFCNPAAIYQRTISRLRSRQDLRSQDVMGQQAVLLTLLVLLATFMVNGYADFRIVFNLMDAALTAIGGEDALMGDLGIFLKRQIRKFRAYASPFFSQVKGVSTLSMTAEAKPSVSSGWECFRSYYNSYPAYSDPLSTLYDMNEHACNIYVQGVLAASKGDAGRSHVTQLVENFKMRLEMIPPGNPGEHILAWSIFIAAAASRTPEHQEYFAGQLLLHYKRNGFANITTALKHLRLLWAQLDQKDWTEYLATMPCFMV